MKISNIIQEGKVFKNEENIALEAAQTSETISEMLDDVNMLRELLGEGKLSDAAQSEVLAIIEGMTQELDAMGVAAIVESVERQFRRYGDKFVRQYRCTTGQKEGRLVSEPSACGKRKDPRRVRQGKATARRKKGQRVRKTLFTKRKTQSKRLTRLNDILRGDTAA